MEVTILIFSLVALAAGQRPSFAGTRPIGYPEVTTEGLIDKFGEDGTTQRLPIEANGDRDLVDRLSKLPIDKQPFWFINWQALEAHRQQGIQTYPQKPNQFIDPIPNTGTNNVANSNPSNVNSNLGGSNSNSQFPNSNPQLPNSNSNFPNSNSNSNTGDALTNANGTPPNSNVSNFPSSPVQADLLNRFGEGDSKPNSGTGGSNIRPIDNMTSSFGAQNVNVINVIPTTTPAPVKTTQRAPYYYQ